MMRGRPARRASRATAPSTPQIIVIRNLGMGGDNSSAFYELQNQFTQGLITADEFIEGVDGKLQMMMLEGM